MGCCGEKRAALRRRTLASEPATGVRPLRTPRPEPQGTSQVVVEYRGEAPVLLRGTATGRLYTFSPARPTRSVPASDARHLLRHPLLEEGRSNGTRQEAVRLGLD